MIKNKSDTFINWSSQSSCFFYSSWRFLLFPVEFSRQEGIKIETLYATNMKEVYELGKLLLVIEGVTDVIVRNGGDGYYYVNFVIHFKDIGIRTEIITLIKEYELDGINFASQKWSQALDRYEINKWYSLYAPNRELFLWKNTGSL